MDILELLQKNDLLKIIDEPCDINLEIAHLSYIEVKKDDSKALFFKKPIDENGNILPPVLTNLYCSFKALDLFMGKNPNLISHEINKILKPEKPRTITEKIDFFKYLFSLKSVIPKQLKTRGICQENELDIDLDKLPILKTWPLDGGKFITMGQIYTQSLDKKHKNLGMYRLQVLGKNKLAMHWQIHKDAAHFFHEYKNAGKKMPVSIGIGGDPLYIWCGQAPLPKNIFELMLYGFIKKTPAKLVKSLSNDVLIPFDLDYVIEGFVDTNEFVDEGPFGDHTGFYTPVEKFPVMTISKITSKKNPIFYATVVGKPPLEDKFMGYATERIFLPLLQTTTPDLIDYKMPENGVFHNLIFAKFNYSYPGQAKQLMHAFWGVGQMSFVKHAIFVPQNAPELHETQKLCEFILNRFSTKSLLISEGICDQLDHASDDFCYGGKLGIDLSVDSSIQKPLLLSDNELLNKLKEINSDFIALKQYFTNTKNPICIVNYDKKTLLHEVFLNLNKLDVRIMIFVDKDVNINNPYMLVWKITNNIDAKRDIFIKDNLVCVDATSKDKIDGYKHTWPQETNCDKEVIKKLINKKLLQDDLDFFTKFEIF